MRILYNTGNGERRTLKEWQPLEPYTLCKHKALQEEGVPGLKAFKSNWPEPHMFGLHSWSLFRLLATTLPRFWAWQERARQSVASPPEGRVGRPRYVGCTEAWQLVMAWKGFCGHSLFEEPMGQSQTKRNILHSAWSWIRPVPLNDKPQVAGWMELHGIHMFTYVYLPKSTRRNVCRTWRWKDAPKCIFTLGNAV